MSKATACDGKTGYETRQVAEDRAWAVGRKNGARMGAYRCRFCRRWHIGHQKHTGRRP